MTKFFKNPLRGQPEKHKPYVPQYKLRGLTPEKIASSSIPEAHKKLLTNNAPVVSYDNPRIRPPATITTNVPYAEAIDSPLGKGHPLPNVGNNVENMWTSVDEMVVDDIGINQEVDPNHPMIDNNNDDLRNYSSIPTKIQAAPGPQMIEIEDGQQSIDDIINSNSTKVELENHEYMLVVSGEIISTGSLSEIQEEVRNLVIEHDILIDDIIVFKRIKIKMGIFLEE